MLNKWHDDTDTVTQIRIPPDRGAEMQRKLDESGKR